MSSALPSTVRSTYGRLQRLMGRREIGLLVLLAILAAGAWGFLAVADQIAEGDAASVDEQILMLFRADGNRTDPIGSHAVASAVRDITALGSVAILSLLVAVVVFFLALSRRRRLALFVLAVTAGGAALSYALKYLYDRPRPSFVPPEALPGDPSFPSGHSASAAVVYLTLGLLLAHSLAESRQKVYVVALAVLLAVLVGVSRIYLGVHWPSDVLAGWTLGGAWALACWQAERMLRRRGLIEAERDPHPDDA